MRTFKYHFLFVIIFSFSLFGKDKVKELYEKGKYDQAIDKYNQIIEKHPDWPELHFGKGAALYKKGNLEEALKEFEKSIANKDPEKKAAALYNAGNALMQKQRFKAAMEFYKRSLEVNPDDYDAKYNFELARHRLQQKQQQKKNNQQNQQNQDKKQNQKQQNQKQQKNKQEQDQKKKQQNNQNQQKQQPSQQKKQQQNKNQSSKSKQEEMKKSEKQRAVRILNALKEQEKKMMKKRMKAKHSGSKKEKDW
ncbi:MAG: tetratricopeptide repeat protein [Candidatus Marinimicrobia bacterium]|nr:tetratricopeptide repeat protein [Candidatus Neomarinimicrobiota bacterium]